MSRCAADGSVSGRFLDAVPLLLRMGLILQLGFAGGSRAGSPEVVDEYAPRFIDEVLEQLPPLGTCTNLPQRADWIHDWLFLAYQRGVARVDDWFIDEAAGEPDLPERVSRLTLGVYGRFKEENGAEWAIEPDFSTTIDLPNLERRLELFVTTEQLDDLLETDPTERDGDIRIGARRQIGRLLPSVGVKVSTSPEAFVSTSLGRTFKWGHYFAVPAQRVFWESDEGFGEVTSLTIDRWIDRTLLRSSSSARWTERSNGLEWEQSLIAGYAWRLLTEARRGDYAGPKNMALGVGWRGSVFGQKSGAGIVDRYRTNLFAKFPLWRPYLFGFVSPELQFQNENDWDDDWSVKFGLEAIFWDTIL